jgi:hypothetical protein
MKWKKELIYSSLKSEYEMKISIKILETDYDLASSEQNPTLTFFVSDADAKLVHRDTNEWIFACPDLLDPDAIIGVDCFTEQKNYNKTPCRHRSGVDNMYVQEVVGRKVRCSLSHTSAPRTIKATLVLKVTASSSDGSLLAFRPKQAFSYTRDQQAGCKKLLRRHIEQSMQPFRNHVLRPHLRSFANIHAPVFKTRVCSLPGIAYWMSEWVGFDEAYLEHLTRLVLERHNVSMTEFLELDLEGPIHQANQILCDVCTIYPTSCPYITDYISKGTRLNPCESFDDLFVRNAGDCEDFSRAITLIFNHIRFHPWENQVGRRLQELSKAYIAFGILGSVTRPSYSGGSGSGIAAHMYVQLIPISLFNKMCPEHAQPIEQAWMHNSSLLIGEGTGHVGCDLLRPVKHTSSIERAWSKRRMEGLERTSYPNLHNSFYRYNIHAYTNYFFKTGVNVGHFTFCQNKRYGVPFESILTKPDSIRMYPHKGFTPEELGTVRSILSKEYPTPALQLSASAATIGSRTKSTAVSVKRERAIDIFSHTKTPALCEDVESFGSDVGATMITWVCEQITDSHLLWRCRVIV